MQAAGGRVTSVESGRTFWCDLKLHAPTGNDGPLCWTRRACHRIFTTEFVRIELFPKRRRAVLGSSSVRSKDSNSSWLDPKFHGVCKCTRTGVSLGAVNTKKKVYNCFRTCKLWKSKWKIVFVLSWKNKKSECLTIFYCHKLCDTKHHH